MMLKLEELNEAKRIIENTITSVSTDGSKPASAHEIFKQIDRYAGIALFALQLLEELIDLIKNWKFWKFKKSYKIIAALVRFVNNIRGLK